MKYIDYEDELNFFLYWFKFNLSLSRQNKFIMYVNAWSVLQFFTNTIYSS